MARRGRVKSRFVARCLQTKSAYDMSGTGQPASPSSDQTIETHGSIGTLPTAGRIFSRDIAQSRTPQESGELPDIFSRRAHADAHATIHRCGANPDSRAAGLERPQQPFGDVPGIDGPAFHESFPARMGRGNMQVESSTKAEHDIGGKDGVLSTTTA